MKKPTLEQAREQLLARLTKGDAFRLGAIAYTVRQDEIKAKLASMTIEEMRQRWPHYTYDWRQA